MQFRPGKRDAWVVDALLAINPVVFLFTMGSNDVLVEHGLVPGDFKAVQLLTSIFLHVGWIHLLGSLFFLMFVTRRRGAPAAAASRVPPTTTCTRCGSWLRAADRAAPHVVPRA